MRIGIDDDGHTILFAVFEHDFVVLIGIHAAVAGLEGAVVHLKGDIVVPCAFDQQLIVHGGAIVVRVGDEANFAVSLHAADDVHGVGLRVLRGIAQGVNACDGIIQTVDIPTFQRELSAFEHVDFTVKVADDEAHIIRRLEREKRVGVVEMLDPHTCRFSAEVYDSSEMIPWIRTFICRIDKMNFSNRTIENQFKKDLEAMYRMYGIPQEVGE